MVAEVFSAMIQGIEGQIVKIQVDISNGIPNFNMIGYLSNEVKESKERVRTALNNIGVLLPPKRISVNFAPADFRKCGTSFDIGVAAAILLAMDFVPETYIKDTLFVGELSLNGQICPISGVLPIVVAASKRGIKRCIVAQENVAEAAFVEQMEVVGCRNLEELFFYLKHGYIINDDSGEILENSGNISEDSGKECTIQDVKKSQEISESTRSLNLLVKDILENALASNKEFLAKCEDQVRKRDDIISNYQKEVYRYEQKTTLENNISKFIVPEILPEPQKVEKAHLEAKKKELLDLLSILSRYEKVQQNKKELAKIKDKYDLAQFAVKVLDSKIGIPALILQRTLRFFEKKCNEKASLLREGFQIHFLSDNGITIQVSPGKGKPFVDMKEVSTGEFVCVAYILMTMIGEATKCHLFLIDNLDRLDTEYLNALLSLLEEDKKIEQVFLGGVDHADVERTLNDKSFQIIHM